MLDIDDFDQCDQVLDEVDHATEEARNDNLPFTAVDFEVAFSGFNLFAQIGRVCGVTMGWKRIGYLRG